MNATARFLGLLLLVSASACGTSVEGGGGGDGEGGSNAGGGGEGGSDTGEVLDLYACNVTPDCVQDVGHLGEALTEEALRCGGELVASGQAGALLSTSQPGPYPTDSEYLVVLVGDGTLYRQGRSRCTSEESCAEQYTATWRRSELQYCTTIDASLATGCDTDGSCEWSGQAEDCVTVEAFTCADLAG